jgi:sugar O-acyltransferase (sialic acid O-acetyltransferase NeuD family)
MLILGAKGHAKEVFEVLKKNGFTDDIAFYDDVTPDTELDTYIKQFTLLRHQSEMVQWFTRTTPDFILGVGGIKARHIVWQKAIDNGGHPANVIAFNAQVAGDITAKEGLNVMQMAFVSNTVNIGTSVLINTRANIHHDVTIGDFCEVGPGALVLGRCKIGSHTFIGSGAIVLPDIIIGNYCTVGAGAVVTKNVSDNRTVKGNPAR